MADRLINRAQTTKQVKKLVDGYYEELRRAPEEGKHVAWTVGPAPFEILRTMNVAFQHLETHGAYIAARKSAEGKKGGEELKATAHDLGYSPDMCSYSRYVCGLAHRMVSGETSDIRPDLILPKPDFVVAAIPCVTMVYAAEAIARCFGVPSFILDLPLAYDSADFPRARDYRKEQLRALIFFLEKQTGRRFDEARLSEMMVRVKEQATIRVECMEMQKNIPAPLTFFDLLISLAPAHVLRGLPQSLEYYVQLRNELRERIAEGISAIPNERLRLYWDNLPIWHKVGSLSEKLAAMGATIVAGNYTHLSFWHQPWKINPEQPLDTLASEYVTGMAARSLDWKIAEVTKLCQEYHVDGMIMHSSRTCRPQDIGQADIIDAVSRNIGVPGVQIESDPTDPDYHSEAQVDTTLQVFVETLEAKKGRRR